MRCIKRLAFLGLCGALLSAAAPALAQEASTGGQVPQRAVIDGFRSAKFGMSEDDVRQAIAIDFHVNADQIKKAPNPVDRTTILEVVVKDVLPSGGKSAVDYMFGYKSHELMSVAVTWTGKLDPTVTDTVLRNNGITLQSYFRGAGYKTDTIRMDVLVPTVGYVLFEGRDADAHMTQLVLGGDLKQDQSEHFQLKPTSLILRYIADPENPDIFRIAPGQF